MLLRDNLEKILVKNWTHFIDLHLLTNFIKEFVKNKDFAEVEIDELDYHKGTVKIKTSSVVLENDGLRLFIDFIVPQIDSNIVGGIELIISDKVTVKNFYGTSVKHFKKT